MMVKVEMTDKEFLEFMEYKKEKTKMVEYIKRHQRQARQIKEKACRCGDDESFIFYDHMELICKRLLEGIGGV